MPKVKNWYFIKSDQSIVKPADVKGEDDVRLFGRVYNDERFDPLTGEFQNGHRIVTSPIQNINWETGEIKTESGTLYILEGDADECYLKYLTKNGETLQ